MDAAIHLLNLFNAVGLIAFGQAMKQSAQAGESGRKPLDKGLAQARLEFSVLIFPRRQVLGRSFGL